MFKRPFQLKNKSNHKSERGNAMVYVLIALALFGFLTITLSSQNDQADGQDLSDEQAELYANELISYVASAQQTVDMMLSTGSEVSDLNFVIPSDAAFNTPPHVHKVFHPQGGGLNYTANYNSEIVSVGGIGGWYFKNTTNVEWTPTTASDVMISTVHMREDICKIYNIKITGSENIPVMPDALNQWFKNASTRDLLVSDCPDCEGYPTMCVKSSGGISHGLYSIIVAQ